MMITIAFKREQDLKTFKSLAREARKNLKIFGFWTKIVTFCREFLKTCKKIQEKSCKIQNT